MQKFKTTLPGYSKPEVNKFLSDVINEYEELLNKLKVSDQKCLQLENELVRYKNLEQTLNRTLIIAEESASNIRSAALKDVELRLENADKNASRIINNALLKAEKINRDTEDARRKLFLLKKHIRNRVEEYLDEIDKLEDII